MTRKAKRRSKDRYYRRPRRAFPNAQVVTNFYQYTTNNHTTDGTFTVTDRVRSFDCPTTLIMGDGVKPNPWWFRKTGSSYVRGVGKFHWPASWQGPAGWAEYRGSLGPYFAYDDHAFPLGEDHSRVSDPNYASSTYNKAISRMYDELRATDLNALLSSYEIKELAQLRGQMRSSTSRMVWVLQRVKKFARVSPLTKALMAVEDAKRLIPSASAIAASSWLTWVYAVRPALSDMQALLNFTGLLTNDRFVKGSASESWSTSLRDLNGRRLLTTQGAIKTKVKAALQVRDAAEFDAWRLGFRSPASFLYEAIPFSFCLDWVYNLGQYYSSLEAAYGHGLHFQYGFMTSTGANLIVTEYDRDFTYVKNGFQKNFTGYYGGNSYHRRSERTVLSSLPRPHVPSLDLDLASQQLLSAAALLRTIFLPKK